MGATHSLSTKVIHSPQGCQGIFGWVIPWVFFSGFFYSVFFIVFLLFSLFFPVSRQTKKKTVTRRLSLPWFRFQSSPLAQAKKVLFSANRFSAPVLQKSVEIMNSWRRGLALRFFGRDTINPHKTANSARAGTFEVELQRKE